MKWVLLFVFFIADAGAMYSVPEQVHHQHWWRLLPGCGFVLAIEYHFGNKMTPNDMLEDRTTHETN